MMGYPSEYPIKSISVEFNDIKQEVDIAHLHDKLYRGLTAENYLTLYSMMKGRLDTSQLGDVTSFFPL